MLTKLDNHGLALIVSIIVMLLLSSLGVFSVSLLSTDTHISLDSLSSAQAFFIAEAGVQEVIYKLKNESAYRSDPSVVIGNIGEGSFSVDVSKVDTTYTLTSTGTVGVVVRTIEQIVLAEGEGDGGYPGGVPEAFNYAMHAFGNHVKFKNATGTVNGDVAATNQVQDYDDPTINGTVTEGSGVDDPSPVDMDGYEGIADHVEGGGFTFEEGNTYGSLGSEEVWYIEGEVTIERGVTIYGSVIAEHKITIGSENIIIDAASGYPALISGNNIHGDGLADSTISGLIYADNNVKFDSLNNVTINATILSDNNTFLRYGDFTINHDPDILDNPVPFFDGYESGLTITLGGWEEETS